MGTQVFVRATLIDGAVHGISSQRGAIMSMGSAAASLSYIANCTIGINIIEGSGVVSASAQVFAGCITNISPAVSSVIPRWWT